MRRIAVLAAAVLLVAVPRPGRAAPPRAEGEIRTDEGRLEILGKPVRVGETVELPEGFIRVEEKGTEDRNVGSFSVVPSASLRATAVAHAALAPALAAAPAGRADAAPATFLPVRSEGPCRAERSAYLRALWKLSGIEVSDPDALLLGLEGGESGPATGYYWFALATDPFRPLAWSSDLRERAESLARCVRGR